MDKTLATKMIHEIAVIWNEKLVSKRFLFVYGKEPYEYAEVVIEKNRLLHLTGAKTKLTADDFFDKALSNKLSSKEYSISPKDYEEKLSVFYRTPTLILNATKIGFSTGSSYYVVFSFALGPRPIVAFLIPNGKAAIPVSFQDRPLPSVAKHIKDIKAVFCRSMVKQGPFALEDLIESRNGFQKELLDPSRVLTQATQRTE